MYFKVAIVALTIISVQAQVVIAGNEDSVDEIAWVEYCKILVKDKLKNSRSAKFRNVYFNRGLGVPIACGEVNSKNSFGGYIGYQKFISAGKSELTYLQEEMSDFHVAWNKLCL